MNIIVNMLLHCYTVTACMGTFKLKYKLAKQNCMNVYTKQYNS